MPKKDEQSWVNDSAGSKRIRVYHVDGDFFLDVPAGARCTFGYFNPAAGGWGGKNDTYGTVQNVGKATALRVYADTTDKRQIACFLGVKGFRDESLKLTKIVQKITVESRLVDDGEGTVEYGGKQMRELSASPEKEF